MIVGCMVGAIMLDYPLKRLIFTKLRKMESFIMIFTHRYGNIWTLMYVKNILQVFVCLILYASYPLNSIELLYIGRFLSGWIICMKHITVFYNTKKKQWLPGITVIAGQYLPVFITECAPVHLRGSAATLAYIGEPLWSLAAACVNLPGALGNKDSYIKIEHIKVFYN